MSVEGRKRILYIEDELAQMEGVIEFLRIDYEVETARNADLALDILVESSTGYDLIILDVRMPQGKQIQDRNRGRTMGVELAEEIQEKYPSIPIVAYTVVHDDKLHDRLLKSGAKAVIMKSEAPSVLKKEIQKWLVKQK